MSRQADRVIDAALACWARVGLAKTTLDDVAREAGCSRATVYRHFPGKQPLVAAAIGREADRLSAEVVDAAAPSPTLADAAVAVVTTGARLLMSHGALAFVVTVEPESILPHISFAGGDALLAEVARRIAPAFTPYLAPEHTHRFAEWLARMSLSYLCSAEGHELLDEARVRTLVEDFVLPGFLQGVTR